MTETGKAIDKKGKLNSRSVLEMVFLVVLVLYPLRHINWGIDLWDTGYSYANFQYMGLEHMDPMWLFSTYLANVVGHWISRLPFAGSLIGMNFYTGLLPGGLAVAGYLFCTRKLGIPAGITFVGELTALGLCWCPTAVLYNYLTFVFLLACVILLYAGLTQGKNRFLFLAGLCLGCNVLVRFSNLPEAVLIVVVWAYGIIEWLEAGRKVKGAGKRTFYRTLWCMGGYLSALALLLGYLHFRYGIDAYVSGIGRLFAMTDKATDYKATSMVTNLIFQYVQNLYWVVRIGVIAAAGLILFGAVKALDSYLDRKTDTGAWAAGKKTWAVLKILSRVCWGMVCLMMLLWLYVRGFCAAEYTNYGAILKPGILFLMLTLGICLVRIFHKNSSKEEKLISGLLFILTLITSIGSNNHVYPSLNNLFLGAPYTLWQCYRFLRDGKDGKLFKLPLCVFPLKGILSAFLILVLVQSFLFGMRFGFAEGTGLQDVSVQVENNEILKGVKMSPERAAWMEEISAYAIEANLAGKEVILYGWIPSLSYYLQMPSAFNPWSGLASYSQSTMEESMNEVRADMKVDASYRPVVLLEKDYVLYLEALSDETGRDTLLKQVGEKKWNEMEQDGKWQLIVEFLEEYGYEQTFRNEKFGIWE